MRLSTRKWMRSGVNWAASPSLRTHFAGLGSGQQLLKWPKSLRPGVSLSTAGPQLNGQQSIDGRDVALRESRP
jgi:hypothetical protein